MLDRRRIAGLLVSALALAACGRAPADAPAEAQGSKGREPVTVLAAASLTDALQAVGDQYRAETGTEVRFSFASSAALAQQIQAGAPADIFVSANEDWMDRLAEKGLIDPYSRVSPIGNDLVLVAPKSSSVDAVTIDSSLDLLSLLGPEGRLSVGDPSSVPAGQYAEEALTKLGLWAAAEPRLAPGLDVRSTLALVERGETPLGIVYGTDARVSDKVKVVGVFPEDTHEPVTYPFALLAGERSKEAKAFFAYLTGEPGLSVMERYGFARQ